MHGLTYPLMYLIALVTQGATSLYRLRFDAAKPGDEITLHIPCRDRPG